jgi:hypothetical protein
MASIEARSAQTLTMAGIAILAVASNAADFNTITPPAADAR